MSADTLVRLTNPLALPQLGEAIETAHQAARGAARTALDQALRCGELLLEAKAAVGHGDWLAWLQAHTTVTPRQSQKYMRLAEHRDALVKCEPSSHLTLTGALRAIAAPTPETEGLTVEDPLHDEIWRLLREPTAEERLAALTSLKELADFATRDWAIAAAQDVVRNERLLALEAEMGFQPGDYFACLAELAQARVQELESGQPAGAEMDQVHATHLARYRGRSDDDP